MRKYSKFIVVAGSLAALTVPSVAMADAPSGYAANPSGGSNNGSQVAFYSAQYIHNGSPNNTNPALSVSQQAQAGDRAANIQALLGH